MPHELALITTIAAGLGLALVLGLVAARLKLPPLVGYLLAGIVIGPATPGFVADVELAGQLAEIGVMLLMFGVGLHFSLDDLLAVRRIAMPGAIVQIGVATGARAWRRHCGGAGARRARWSSGWRSPWPAPSCCCGRWRTAACSSSMNGRIAVGWLVVEDLVDGAGPGAAAAWRVWPACSGGTAAPRRTGPLWTRARR